MFTESSMCQNPQFPPILWNKKVNEAQGHKAGYDHYGWLLILEFQFAHSQSSSPRSKTNNPTSSSASASTATQPSPPTVV